MATDAPDTSSSVVPTTDTPPAVIRRDIVAVYESMIADVPDAGQGGFEGILEAIALATDIRDLDAPWRSEGLEAFRNVPLILTGIRKLPSDFTGGLPWFLIADGAIIETGETISLTSGAVSVVAQLAKAWQLGKFPVKVIPRIADKPSANGYYPQHLEFVV